MEDYIVSIHPHPLKRNVNDNGWACDGRVQPSGCKSGCTEFYQTDNWKRYRCQACDFDLCAKCLEAYQIEPQDSYRVKYHHHILEHIYRDRFWSCNGRNLGKGCAFTGFKSSKDSLGLKRFRCNICDFDLCEPCMDQYNAIPQNNYEVKRHPHKISRIWDNIHWVCNGITVDGKCKSNTQGIIMTADSKKYGCQGCNFYLCELCMNHRLNLGPITNEEENKISNTENEEKKTGICAICFNTQKLVVIVHRETGHQCCCYQCASLLKINNQTCPICRLNIDAIVKIYS